VNAIPFERLFSMSAFEALKGLRQQQVLNPELSLSDLTRIAVRLDPDIASLDLEAASDLAEILPHTPVEVHGSIFYRTCIEAVILHRQPIWAKIMTMGRQKFTSKLARDEQQCFREAGLLDDPPTVEIIKWWDRVTGQVRLAGEQVRLERARVAEKLSLDREVERLNVLGIDRKPKWIAIEDNTAGYDVLSYDPGSTEPTNRLIEVKSTIASPLRFILTRHEWEQACRFGSSYHFHIWNLQSQPPSLFERTVADVAPHIPTDNEKGTWKTAEIPVGSN